VIFWNPKHWALHPRASDMFLELESAQIFFKDPVSAAKHVNVIFSDPLIWWGSDKVQTARKKFCTAFANVSENQREQWLQALTFETKN
jgi:putative transferase (TIGR04331 family)